MAAPSSEEALGLCCEIVDAIAAVAPRGWTRADLALDRRGAQLRVTGIDAGLDAPPLPKPDLGMDEAGRIGGMSAALTELLHLLHQQGVEWDGSRARATRGDGHVGVTLLNRDGRPASAVALDRDHIDALFLGEPLLAALVDAHESMRARDERTRERLRGMKAWRYSQPDRRATFEREGAAPLEITAQILGTWSSEDETWLWGWANTSVEPRATELVEKALAPERHEPGFAVLWRERYPCEEGFATAVAGLAAHRMDAAGVFRGRAGGAWLYLALLD